MLEEVEATEVPRVEVYNKCDLLVPDERRRLAEADPSAVLISAATGEGCDELLESIAARVALDQQRVCLALDLTSDRDRERLSWLYRHGRVHSQVMQGDHATIEADVPRRLVDRVGPAAIPRVAGGRRA